MNLQAKDDNPQDMSEATPAREPRRRKHDKSEIAVSFLPVGNPAAKWAYLSAIIGLIPGIGVVMGLPAFILGVIGGRAAKRDEQKRGMGHARLSRLLGLLEILSNAAGWALLASAA